MRKSVPPRRREKMKKWKTIWLFALVIAAVLLLPACGLGRLPEGFAREDVEAAARSVVELLNRKDQAALEDLSTPRMKEAMTDKLYQRVFEDLEALGGFKEVNGIIIQGTTEDKTGEPIAVATVQATYEERDVIFTISFDPDMKLAGLYMK